MGTVRFATCLAGAVRTSLPAELFDVVSDPAAGTSAHQAKVTAILDRRQPAATVPRG